MDWYIANLDDLDRGDEILPLRGPIYVANSHKLAVACWRYWELVHPRRKLTYYRVQPVSYEGELRPVDEITGLFECETIKIIERMPDGSGSPPGTERYSDEEDLWPLVETTQWPDGSPVYNSQGYVANQPNLIPVAGLDQFVEGLRQQRYRLPFFIKKYVETHSTYRFGREWPPWDWQPG